MGFINFAKKMVRFIVALQGHFTSKNIHETENASAHIYLNRGNLWPEIITLKKCMKNSRLLKASMIMLLW